MSCARSNRVMISTRLTHTLIQGQSRVVGWFASDDVLFRRTGLVRENELVFNFDLALVVGRFIFPLAYRLYQRVQKYWIPAEFLDARHRAISIHIGQHAG